MSVVAASVIAAVLTVGLVSVASGVVATSKVKAQLAADLSALSGAASAPSSLRLGGESACLAANEAAIVNGAGIEKCWVEDGDIKVIVSRNVEWFGFSIPTRGRARAGPASRRSMQGLRSRK